MSGSVGISESNYCQLTSAKDLLHCVANQQHLNFCKKEQHIMERWICTICQYVYDPTVGDPDRGIAPGTSFEALPDDWCCPLCGAGKDVFEKE
jgi:rubredoxin